MFPIAVFIFYLIYIYFLFFFALTKKYPSDNLVSFLVLISFIVLNFTFSGKFSDWSTYNNYVENCTELNCTYFEPLFNILIYVSSVTIGFDLVKIFFLIVLIFTINRLKVNFEKFSKWILIFSLIFSLIPLYLGAIRQAIAFCFILLAIFENKKRFKIIFFILGTGFHYSALIIIPIILLYNSFSNFFEKSYFRIIILLLLCFFIGYFFPTEYIPEIIKSGDYYIENSSLTKDLIIILERIIFIIISLFLIMRNNRDKTNYNKFIRLTLIGSLVFITFYFISRNMSGRLLAFYRVSDLFVLYYFISHKISTSKNYISISFFSSTLLVLYSLIKFYFTIYSVGFFSQ